MYESVQLGPVRLDELTWSLPGVTFPLDLGGGVRSFRHRRGVLQRVAVSLGLSELEVWLTKRLGEPAELGALLRPVAVWPLPEGLGVGVFGERGVVAADLLWCPRGGEGGFVVSRPRGVLEQPQPVLTSILSLVSRVLGEAQTHDGRVVRMPEVVKDVLRVLLPSLGFRLPELGALRCGGIEFRADRLHVVFDRGLPPWATPASVARAREFATIAASGDQALLAGDWSAARQAYVAALEQAPRHPELAQTIAGIDTHFAERAEAALGLLVESLPAVEFGLVGAELLAKTGDGEGARLAVSKLVHHERFPPLGAAYWVKLSEWLTSSSEKAEVIELALACSAASVAARRARFRTRVELGDVHGAVADAEHLEAAARGSEAKHGVLLQCALVLTNVGFVDAAAKLFERALRYAPGDARSSLGVALGLVEAGKFERAIVVLQRTLEASHVDEAVAAEANVALGRLLAERAGDLPAAIARVRRAAGLTKTAVEARGYEAMWRAQIGDIAGATLAFARLNEVVASCPEVAAHRAAHWLMLAGKFALEQTGDALAAERFLGQALRRMPQNPAVAEAYRVAALRVAQRPRLTNAIPEMDSDGIVEPDPSTPTPSRGSVQDYREETRAEVSHDPGGGGSPSIAAPEIAIDAPVPPDEYSELSEIEVEQRVDLLKAQLMATSHAPVEVVTNLVVGLGKLGRLEEAYALLRAQYDDSSGGARERLGTALVQVLTQLVDWAHSQGKTDDAELYEMTRSALESE